MMNRTAANRDATADSLSADSDGTHLLGAMATPGATAELQRRFRVAMACRVRRASSLERELSMGATAGIMEAVGEFAIVMAILSLLVFGAAVRPRRQWIPILIAVVLGIVTAALIDMNASAAADSGSEPVNDYEGCEFIGLPMMLVVIVSMGIAGRIVIDWHKSRRHRVSGFPVIFDEKKNETP